MCATVGLPASVVQQLVSAGAARGHLNHAPKRPRDRPPTVETVGYKHQTRLQGGFCRPEPCISMRGGNRQVVTQGQDTCPRTKHPRAGVCLPETDHEC